MAFSLRLPPDLDRAARLRAGQIGIPLNGLICFALDQYLRGGAAPGRSETVVDDLDFRNPHRVSYGGMPLKAAPRPSPAPSVVREPGKLFSAAEAVAIAKSASAPVLQPLKPPSEGSTRAERRAFTQNQRLLRKQATR